MRILLKRVFFSVFKRLGLHLERLVRPGVAGRAEGEIGGAVGIGEVELVAHRDRAVIALRWRDHVNEPVLPSSAAVLERVRNVHSPSLSGMKRTR